MFDLLLFLNVVPFSCFLLRSLAFGIMGVMLRKSRKAVAALGVPKRGLNGFLR